MLLFEDCILDFLVKSKFHKVKYKIGLKEMTVSLESSSTKAYIFSTSMWLKIDYGMFIS